MKSIQYAWFRTRVFIDVWASLIFFFGSLVFALAQDYQRASYFILVAIFMELKDLPKLLIHLCIRTSK
jgi:hypothetical protein